MLDSWVGCLGAAYLWVVALHVIFVIFLMAGLMMMPRYFVYHQESAPSSDEEARWVARENKLRKIILNPSLIAVWILGLMLAAHGGFWSQGWFLVKLALVLCLSAYHGWLVGYAKALAQGKRWLSGKHLRLLNELPSLLTIIIVILVFVKPF
ncbi:MAG: CopD family protein [Sphingopyxis sp.]